jgi:hypothetical protein
MRMGLTNLHKIAGGRKVPGYACTANELMRRFFIGLDVLSSGGIDWSLIMSGFVDASVPPYMVRSYLRDLGAVDGRYLARGTALGGYVLGCLGHRVPSSLFLGSPYMCVLYSRMFVGGRWLDGEGVISGNDVACLLYARYVVGGELPGFMHNRMVMESYVGCSEAMRVYFREFGGD